VAMVGAVNKPNAHAHTCLHSSTDMTAYLVKRRNQMQWGYGTKCLYTGLVGFKSRMEHRQHDLSFPIRILRLCTDDLSTTHEIFYNKKWSVFISLSRISQL
jgi:hypothetical protein